MAHAVDHDVRDFKRQVGRATARMRPIFAILLVMTMAFTISVLAWDRWMRGPQLELAVSPSAFVMPAGCTPLQVEQVIRNTPMYGAETVTCLAVAGKIDRARQLLSAMNDADRSQAIYQVFNVAHPIADAGDDRSAGPLMALVVEFWPDNYMAVFHAGMADSRSVTMTPPGLSSNSSSRCIRPTTCGAARQARARRSRSAHGARQAADALPRVAQS